MQELCRGTKLKKINLRKDSKKLYQEVSPGHKAIVMFPVKLFSSCLRLQRFGINKVFSRPATPNVKSPAAHLKTG